MLFDSPRILRFSVSSLFNVFLLSVFFFYSMFPAVHPLTKGWHYQYDTIRGQHQLGKNTDFSLCIVVALYVKAFEPYSKHLGISYCMFNFLKALCGSFRRAAPFVEHLRNGKKIYYKVTKEKDQTIFSHMVSFCYKGG